MQIISSIRLLRALVIGFAVVTASARAAAINQPPAVQIEGAIVSWGFSGSGPVSAGLSSVVAIAAGSRHTVALKSDGTVVAWGYNDYGQTTAPAGLSGVVAIAAGDYYTVALKSDGTVVAWGYNAYGRTNVPAGLTGVVAIAAGERYTVALKSDGTVVAWGHNGVDGQTNVPAGLTGVVAIAAGSNHTVALKSDGTVVAWGYSLTGQTNVPAGLTGVVAIAAGGNHTVALKSDGTVVAWGYNNNGQTNVPAGLTGVVAIAAGSSHTVALKSDRTVVAWGHNNNGQTNVPAGLTGVAAIAAGTDHTVALKRGISLAEDATSSLSAFPISLTGITAGTGETTQNVTVTATSSDPAVIPNPAVDIGFSYTAPGGLPVYAGTMTLAAPPHDWFGTVIITVTVKDDGGTAGGGVDTTTRVFPISILPANDPPAFTKGADITVPETAAGFSQANWASNFSVGPANESNQTFQFIASVSNTAVFSVQPAIDTTGTLTFTPADNIDAETVVPVTATMLDSGGTANGGADSLSQIFTITLTPVASTLVVKNTNDNGSDSLRDCIARARRTDTVAFDPEVFDLANSDMATVINVLSELPPLRTGITLDAQDRRVTLNGTGAPSANGLVITSNGNVVRGLTIVGFDKSGVCIKGGAKNNVLGGNRLTGTGPNGQGLRIGNNGSAGVLITGDGTDGNTVKGCWIGLTASGEEALPNLAGVLIDGGAKSNVLGGTESGERNVISGNYYEGITVSGAGSDGNVIAGNILGAAAATAGARGLAASRGDDALTVSNRPALGNGSSGIFLSKGTSSTRVGGETLKESNLIAHNGGNGIEVRAAASKRNTARSNLISRNARGGIKLYDGSNENVLPPVFSHVLLQSANAATGISKVFLDGTAAGEGSVEVYSDAGQQGGTFLGQHAVSGGFWSLTVDAPASENITATFTDANGNTSPFAVYGKVPSLDSDGDGVPDTLEIAAGTDPNNPSDMPQSGTGIDIGQFSLKLDFVRKSGDQLKASIRLTLPEGFTNDDADISVTLGDYQTGMLALDGKGASPRDAVNVKLSGVPKAGVKNGMTTGKLTVTVRGGDLLNGLRDYGFAQRVTDRKGEALALPVSVVIRSQGTSTVYSSSCAVIYKANERTGTGKKTAK